MLTFLGRPPLAPATPLEAMTEDPKPKPKKTTNNIEPQTAHRARTRPLGLMSSEADRCLVARGLLQERLLPG